MQEKAASFYVDAGQSNFSCCRASGLTVSAVPELSISAISCGFTINDGQEWCSRRWGRERKHAVEIYRSKQNEPHPKRPQGRFHPNGFATPSAHLALSTGVGAKLTAFACIPISALNPAAVAPLSYEPLRLIETHSL